MSLVEIYLPQPVFVFFKSMRYTAFSTTSSTSFYGQHVQLRCFCFGLENCHFAERGAKRKNKKLNYPVRDKNRTIIQQARANLPKDRLLRFTAGGCWSGIGCHGIGRPWEGLELPGKPKLFALK